MKRITILLTVLTMGLFAAAAKESKLSGTIALTGKIKPELQSNGKSYVLLLPRFLEFDMKEGAKAEVIVDDAAFNERGFFALDEEKKEYLIKSLTIDGKEINVSDFTERGPGRYEDCPIYEDGRRRPGNDRGKRGSRGRGDGSYGRDNFDRRDMRR